MSAMIDLLRLLCVASLGVFAGAMLTEGGVLVPYWRSLSAQEFYAWYAANDARLLGFFGPLTTTMAILAVLAAIGGFWQVHPGRWFSAVAAVLCVFVVSTFFLYFQQANASFTAASVSATELPAELARWAWWHGLRTVVSFLALALALRANSL